MRFILAFLALFSLPLQAQEMSSEYQILGYIDLVMEGEERRFPIVVTPDNAYSFAHKYETYRKDGIFKIRLAGITPGADGEWSYPMIAVDITTHKYEMLRTIYVSYSTESFRADYNFSGATGDEFTSYGDLVEGEDGLIEFNFKARLVHYDMDPDTRESTPQADKPPVEVTGHVSVTIPEEYRED